MKYLFQIKPTPTHFKPVPKDFALLLCSSAVNNLGSTMLMVALPFYVYELTGQAAATGASFFFLTLPRVLFGSAGGVFADRANRQRLSIITNLASAAALLPLLLVRSVGSVWLIYAVSFVGYSLGQFAGPTERAMLAGLVGREKLVRASALFTVSSSLVSLLGPPLGGFILGVAGFSSVVLVDVVSFVLAAVLIVLIGTRFPSPVTTEIVPRTVLGQLRAPWSEWLDGLRLIGRQREIKLLFAVSGIAMVEEGIFNSLWAVWVNAILHATSFQFGLLGSALGGGFLLGGVTLARLGNRLNTYVVGASALALGGLSLAIINFPVLGLAITLTTIKGVPAVGFFDGITILLQQHVQEAYIGRLLGSFNTVRAIMLLVGTTLAILLAEKVSVVTMLNAASLLWIISGLATFAWSKSRG